MECAAIRERREGGIRHGRSLELEIFGPDRLLVTMQDCSRAFHAETGFSSISGIEEQHLPDLLAKRFVGMPEHDHVRLFPFDPLFQRFIQSARVDNVMNQELAASQVDSFG